MGIIDQDVKPNLKQDCKFALNLAPNIFSNTYQWLYINAC